MILDGKFDFQPEEVKTTKIVGDVIVEGSFPKWLTNVEICGSFYCVNNNLINLVGSPKYVSGSYACTWSKVESLLGSPEYVGGDFICAYNLIRTLLHRPNEIGGKLICDDHVKYLCEGKIIKHEKPILHIKF